jgi:integrase/transposase
MRGDDNQQDGMFSYISPEKRVPADHPLRPIRKMVDEILKEMSPQFAKLYSDVGRPSIAPEPLLRSLLVQIFYSVRSERMLMEQLQYNLLFRWFVGMEMNEGVWNHAVFSKNRERLLNEEIAESFFQRVLNRMAELLRPINQGWQTPKAMVTLRQFVREHWEPKVFCLFKPSRQVGYRPILTTHLLPCFGDKVLFEITPAEVQGFLSDKSKTGIAWHSVRNMRNLLRSILRTATEWGYIEDNPVTRVKLPPRPRRTPTEILRPEQVQKLVAQMREPYRSMVLLAVLTGLRRGELFALRWGAVNFGKGTLDVRESVYNGHFSTPKTRSSVRCIPLSSPAIALLQAHQSRVKQSDPEQLVFGSRVGKPFRPDNILKRVLQPLCRKLKCPRVGWHTFRHVHATLLSELGEPLKTSQEVLGHSDMQTTLKVYTHAVSESVLRAEERLAKVVLDPIGPKSEKGVVSKTEQGVWIQ